MDSAPDGGAAKETLAAHAPVVRGSVPPGTSLGPPMSRQGGFALGFGRPGSLLDFPFTSWMLQTNYLPPQSYVSVT